MSRNFGFLLAILHLTSLAITVGKLCLVHADASFFQSPNLSNTHIQLASTTVYNQIIIESLRQKRSRCKMLLPEKIVVCFTKGYLCVGASRGSAHLKTFLEVRL